MEGRYNKIGSVTFFREGLTQLKGGDIMRKKVALFVVILTLFSFVSGCYYWSAKKEIESAEALFAQLESAGAMAMAPYEYKSAEKFLENAKAEFGENDSQHALVFAQQSKAAAETALAKSK